MRLLPGHAFAGSGMLLIGHGLRNAAVVSVSITGLTDNPTYGLTAQDGVPLTLQVSNLPEGVTVTAYAWFSQVQGQIAATQSFTPDADQTDLQNIFGRVTLSNGQELTTSAYIVRYAAPTVTGSLADVAIVEGSGNVTRDFGALVTGEGGTYSVLVDGAHDPTIATINGSGLITVLDDTVFSATSITARYANSGGEVEATFTAEVFAESLPAPTFYDQPTISTGTIGDTLTLTEGTAGPSATLTIESFTLEGVDKTGELVGLTWDTTGESAGTVALQVRASNGTAPDALSDIITYELLAPVAAPVAAGALDDVTYTQGTGDQTVDISGDFTGSGLVFSKVSGSSAATIDPDTGVVTISTDAAIATSTLVFRATNGGGFADTAFDLTINAAVATLTQFGALTPVGLGGAATTAPNGTYGPLTASGGILTPNTSPMTPGTVDVAGTEWTIVADVAHLRASEVSANIGSLLTCPNIKVRSVTDRAVTITIPGGLNFTGCVLEGEDWTQGANPSLTTSNTKIGRILYYTNANPLRNLTIQGFDLERTDQLHGAWLLHIGRPTRNCTIQHNRLNGPDLTVERQSGRLATFTHPRVNGLRVSNDPNNSGSGRHYGITVVDNYITETSQGLDFTNASNDGTKLSILRDNWVDGVWQRPGIYQYLLHSTDYGASGRFTKSGAPAGVIMEGNRCLNILADFLDSNKVGGSPATEILDRIHSGIWGFNEVIDGLIFLGNYAAIGPRLGVDFPGNNGTAATGHKLNDASGANVYRNIDIAFNITLAKGITLEIEGGQDCWVYHNLIFSDPWNGGSSSVTLRADNGLRFFNNIIQSVSNVTTTLYGVTTADTWEGYGNLQLRTVAPYDDISEYGDVDTTTPDIATYWDEWIPQVTARAATAPTQPGPFGSGLYTPGDGEDSVVYDPPASVATDAATLDGVVFDGSQRFSWSGTYGAMFTPNTQAATVVLWVKNVATGTRKVFASQSSRMIIEFFNGRLQVKFSNNDVTQFDLIATVAIPADDEYHSLALAVSDGRAMLAVDGAFDPFPEVIWSGDLDFTWRGNLAYLMRSTTDAQRFQGSIKVAAIHNGFVDLETDAGWSQIFTSDGQLRAPGSDGSNWFGEQPGLYMAGDAAAFPTNHGYGPNMTLTGTLVTDAGGDVTAPTLSSPTNAANGTTASTASVSTNEGNGTLYTVVTTSGTAPSAAQVKAGQNNAGSAAAFAGSQAVSGTGVQTISPAPSGLTAATTYYTHFMHEDASGNQSAVASAAGFTTASAGPSSVSHIASDSSGGHSIAIPAGATAGRILVQMGFALDAAGSLASPAGWTMGAGNTALSRYSRMAAKVATGTESGNTYAVVNNPSGGSSRAAVASVLQVNAAVSAITLHGSGILARLGSETDSLTMGIAGSDKPMLLVAYMLSVDPTGTITGRHNWAALTPQVNTEIFAGPGGRGAHIYARVYSGSDALTDALLSLYTTSGDYAAISWMALELS